VRLFDRLDAAAAGEPEARLRRLLEVQGAALMHLDLAVKHDGELGRVWVRRLKAAGPAWRPSPFALAVSFALAGVPRHAADVTLLLRALVVGAHRDEAARAAAAWLPPPSADEAGAGSCAALEGALLRCARNAAAGQAAVVAPVVQLAAALMEAGGGGGGGGGAAGWYRPDGSLDHAAAPPSARTADLGTRLLAEVFAGHKESRPAVLALCTARMVGAREDEALPFVRLVAQLVRRHPGLAAAHVADCRAMLEQLPAMAPPAALALLLAVWPLCRARRDVRDFVVLALRKAMFGREVGARLLAARGFLFLIADELARGGGGGGGSGGGDPGAWPSCSQAAPSQMSQMDALAGGGGGGTLQHELISFLRRCLSQQPEVRRAVYEGLPALLAADPAAREAAAEPLLPHLSAFCERDAALSPPLKLEPCARQQPDGRARLVEPLQHLLVAVRRLLRHAPAAPPLRAQRGGSDDDDDDDESDGDAPGKTQGEGEVEGGEATQALRRLFASLRARVGACPLEDFGFDQSTAFAASDPGGELNQAAADLLLGCYEAVMEEVAGEAAAPGLAAADPARSEALAAELLTLFQQHRRLRGLAADAMRGGGKAKGGAAPAAGGGGAGGAPVPLDKRAPALSVGCLVSLLGAVVEDGLAPGGTSVAPNQSAHLKLARSVDFQAFVLGAARGALAPGGAAEGLAAAVAAGTAGDPADSALLRDLYALPDLAPLAAPLFAAAQTTLLARCRERAPPAPGAKREKDEGEGLTQAAAAALERLMARAGGGGIEALAELLRGVPPASRQLHADAALAAAARGAPGSPLALVADRLPLFKQLLDTLVEHCCGKELEPACAALLPLAAALPPPAAAALARWVGAACAAAPEQLSAHPGAARALVALSLRCHAAAGGAADVEALRALAKEVQACVNADGAAADTGTLAFEPSARLPLLGPRSLNAVLAAGLTHMESCMAGLEWALGRLKSAAAAAAAAPPDDGAAAAAAARQRGEWEGAVFARLRVLVEAAAALTEARLSGPPCEALLRALAKLYRLLAAAAAGQAPPRGAKKASPPAALRDLADEVNAHLTDKVYRFIGELKEEELGPQQQENAPAASPGADGDGDADRAKAAKAAARRRAAAAARAQRDSRAFSGLVYRIEEFERQLIQLSRAAGAGVNLMARAKRATNRDFRIPAGAAQPKRQRLEDQAGGGEEGEDEGDDEQEEEGQGVEA
jgi:Fanconi anemia group I protein